jgi:hypothetical protein
MAHATNSAAPALPRFKVAPNGNSISGLSSGAFMTVQLHLAHSASFIGAGIIAGGPYRCVETYRNTSMDAEDAYAMNALYICMTPLTPRTAPNTAKLAELARQTAAAGRIDPISNLADDRLYIFTGSKDSVVSSLVVQGTRAFYEQLGVPAGNILFVNTVPAGHSIITTNPEDSPLETNQPPYINRGDFMQSHCILRHIYGKLEDPAQRLGGQLLRFDQTPFLDNGSASMSPFGYVYIPDAVRQGAPARGVHIAIHGCKQGYEYTNFVNGRPDTANQPPYGNRYITTTGYNEMAEANNLIILYPQATGDDDDDAQNPDGCWDWWGYTDSGAKEPDYYSRNAVQIRALHRMLEQLCGG